MVAAKLQPHERRSGVGGQNTLGESRRALQPLRPGQALALLSTVGYGRVVFTDRALPAIRPVNHIIDRGMIIVRADLRAAVTTDADAAGSLVTYQADKIDPVTRLGWSVVVTGFAHRVTRQDDLDRYQQMLLAWLKKASNVVLAIQPEAINGFSLVEEA